MDIDRAITRLSGCYVTVPTMFRDPDLEVDEKATRRNVKFILDGGINDSNGVLLATGAAGDFPTMSFEERVRITDAIVTEANGRIAVAMGAQTTSTQELARLVKAAARLGAEYVQVSCPYYFKHTEEDFYEYVVTAAEAADIGIVVYNTFWTSSEVSLDLLERFVRIPNVVGLKWSTPSAGSLHFEQAISSFRNRLCIIDNQNQFVTSHMIGAKAFECHVFNFWPEWGARLIQLLNERQYEEVQKAVLQVVLPFCRLWEQIERDYTGGDGYLDKLCMELVGLDSSRCRPPTRDIRARYREQARRMLLGSGVPRVKHSVDASVDSLANRERIAVE